jgi:DNA-directed RNA polymerase sigma subunit (sigma70/sigma32)
MYGDQIEDVNSETPDKSTSTRLRAKELANALSHLNPRMRRVLALRFGLDGA